MKSTRRKFFHVLLGAAAAVPILLAGRAPASKTSTLKQDRARPKFLDESEWRWIDSDYIRFINTQNVKRTVMGSWVEFTLPPDAANINLSTV